MPSCYFCNLKILVFDQRSPARPVLELRGGSRSITQDGAGEGGQKFVCLIMEISYQNLNFSFSVLFWNFDIHDKLEQT